MKGIEKQLYSEYSIYQLRRMVYLLQLLNCQENLSCISWSYFYSKVDIQDILIGVFDCFWRFIDTLFTDNCRKLLSD